MRGAPPPLFLGTRTARQREPLPLPERESVADQLERRRHRVTTIQQPAKVSVAAAQRWYRRGRKQFCVLRVWSAMRARVGHRVNR